MKKKNRKVGRPTDCLKNKILKVRLTDDEYNRLTKYCEDNKIERSSLVRNILFNEKEI